MWVLYNALEFAEGRRKVNVMIMLISVKSLCFRAQRSQQQKKRNKNKNILNSIHTKSCELFAPLVNTYTEGQIHDKKVMYRTGLHI